MRKPLPFGKYYLLERISVGGMAEVFKAKVFGVEGFEKILALKRILPTMAEDEEFIEMFVDEAKIAGQLSHANVCQIYELGCVDDTHFIAMEYIHGKDILQIQNRFRKMKRHMPPQMAAYMASKICEGLDYAHRKKDANANPLNIIHRDVSPQNILASYEGEVKIIDFGIAKAANRSNQTQAGILKGKFGYMSPEQVRGLPLDRRSDVFAVGTVLYEMLTGERLFVGESDFSTLEKVRHVDVPLPTQVNPKIPRELEEIIMKALTKSVEERYEWSNDMADELNRYLLGCEPMYSAKRLSHWMKTTFADDLAKDGRKVEQYRKIGPDGLVSSKAENAPSRPVQAAAVAVPGGVPARGARATEVWGTDDVPEAMLVEDSDVVVEEIQDLSDMATLLVSDAETGEVSGEATLLFDSEASADGGVAEQKTMLFDSGAAAGGLEVAELKTQLVASPFDDEGGDVQAQKTMLFDTSAGDPAMAEAPRASAPAPASFSGVMGAGYGGVPVYAPGGTPAGGVQVVPLPPPRSSIGRDILLAMVVGFIAVVGVIIAFTLLQPGEETDRDLRGSDGEKISAKKDKEKSTPAETGLKITTKPAVREAEVFVNGERLCVEVPCNVRDLPEGKVRIKVIADDYERFEGTVRVEADKLVEFTAEMKPLPKGRAKIKVVVDKKGADITIDGKAYDPKTGFVEVAAGTEHTVRVAKLRFAAVEKSVVLEKDEERVVELELEPARLTLKIDSKPVKGYVQINGEKLGVTPLERGDLAIDRTHLVVVTAEGYETFKRKVRYEKTDEVMVIAELKPEKADKVKPGGGTASTGKVKVSGKDPKVVPKKGKGRGFLIANSRPFAKLLIDGKPTKYETPVGPPGIPLSAGKHKITFRLADGRDVSYTVDIKKDETARLIKNLDLD